MLEVIYLVLSILGLSEAFLSYKKRSNRDTRKTRNDRLSLLAIWFTVGTSIFFAIVFVEQAGAVVPITPITIAGIFLTLLGSFIRWKAIIQLKDAFTVDVSIVFAHDLKTDGIFARVRHPSYTGLLLNYIGVGIAMNNLCSFLILTIPIITVILYRIHVEETLLKSEFGEKYLTYIKSTKKIIPLIY